LLPQNETAKRNELLSVAGCTGYQRVALLFEIIFSVTVTNVEDSLSLIFREVEDKGTTIYE
jgi:hypothetical protein